MARNMTIELIRPGKWGHAASVAAACSLALVLGALRLTPTSAYYAASDNTRHMFVLSPGVRISLTEVWTSEDGRNIAPGTTVTKRPSITNNDGPCYARILMRITDTTTGRTLDPVRDAQRIKLILGTLWRDTKGKIVPGTPYSQAELGALEGVEPLYDHANFNEPKYLPEAGAYSFEYKGVMQTTTEQYALFDKVAVPEDYRENDIWLMGDYTISIQAQAIQAAGFDSQSAAMDALGTEGVFHDA